MVSAYKRRCVYCGNVTSIGGGGEEEEERSAAPLLAPLVWQAEGERRGDDNAGE